MNEQNDDRDAKDHSRSGTLQQSTNLYLDPDLTQFATGDTSLDSASRSEDLQKPTPEQVDVDRRFGRYQLVQQIGNDLSGELYKAIHLPLRKQVVIRKLRQTLDREETRERFAMEVQRLCRLDHPNLIRVETAGANHGTPYFEMESVDGISLAELIDRVGVVDPADACQLVGQAVVGLAELSRLEISHGDISVSNLMISSAGCVKLGCYRVGASEQLPSNNFEGVCHVLRALVSGSSPSGRDGKDAILEDGAMASAEEPLVDATIRSDIRQVIERMKKDSADGGYSSTQHLLAELAPLAIGCDIPALLRRAEVTVDDDRTERSIDTAGYLRRAVKDEDDPTPQNADKADSRRISAPAFLQAAVFMHAATGIALVGISFVCWTLYRQSTNNRQQLESIRGEFDRTEKRMEIVQEQLAIAREDSAAAIQELTVVGKKLALLMGTSNERPLSRSFTPLKSVTCKLSKPSSVSWSDVVFVAHGFSEDVQVPESGNVVLQNPRGATDTPVTIIAPGCSLIQGTITFGNDPSKHIHEFALEPLKPEQTVTFSGRVLWPDGSPASNAIVRICDWAVDRCDAEGRFRIPDVVATAFDVRAESPGGEYHQTIRFIPGSDMERVLVLEKVTTVGIRWVVQTEAGNRSLTGESAKSGEAFFSKSHSRFLLERGAQVRVYCCSDFMIAENEKYKNSSAPALPAFEELKSLPEGTPFFRMFDSNGRNGLHLENRLFDEIERVADGTIFQRSLRAWPIREGDVYTVRGTRRDTFAKMEITDLTIVQTQ